GRDRRAAAGMDLEALLRAQQRASVSALRLLRASVDRATPVWFVTRNVHAVIEGDRIDGLASAPLVGLIRVANNEREGRVSLVDLDDCACEEAADLLADEVARPPEGEIERAYRRGRRYTLRLRPTRLDTIRKRLAEAVRRDGSVTPYRLQTERPGVLTHLSLHETARRAPAPDEIEIRVHA